MDCRRSSKTSRISCGWCTRATQPLIDARYDEYLEGAVIDGRVIQPLRLILRDGTVLVALYTMEKIPDEEGDARWRIAGCLLAPSTVKSAASAVSVGVLA
jgi:hypothetical protein